NQTPCPNARSTPAHVPKNRENHVRKLRERQHSASGLCARCWGGLLDAGRRLWFLRTSPRASQSSHQELSPQAWHSTSPTQGRRSFVRSRSGGMWELTLSRSGRLIHWTRRAVFSWHRDQAAGGGISTRAKATVLQVLHAQGSLPEGRRLGPGYEPAGDCRRRRP